MAETGESKPRLLETCGGFAHHSTRTKPCTFNAAPAPVVSTWRREGLAWPLPYHLV